MKKGFISLLGLVAIIVIVAVVFLEGPGSTSHAVSTNTGFSSGYPQLNLPYHGGPVMAGHSGPVVASTANVYTKSSHLPSHAASANTSTSFIFTYHGGPVMVGTTNVYAIFWESNGTVSANYNSLIKRFLGDFGNSPLYKVVSQYTQTGGGSPTNAVLAGTWVDSTAYVRSAVWDSDIQASVTHAQQANGWTSSLNNLFIVFTEQNETLSSGYCGYHSHFFGTETIYAAIPYVATSNCGSFSGPNHDDADSTINALSFLEMDSITNPLGNAWYTSSNGLQYDINVTCTGAFGPVDSQGADVVWNGNPYLVQREWDKKTSSCILSSSTCMSTFTYYKIVNRNSALELDTSGGSGNAGAQVVQWTNQDSLTQQWSLVPDGQGYQIVNRSSGLVLDVSGGSTSTGAHIIQWTNDNGSSQLWILRSQGGYEQFLNANSGLALDVSGVSTSIGASVVQTQWTFGASLSQQWSLLPVTDPYHPWVQSSGSSVSHLACSPYTPTIA